VARPKTLPKRLTREEASALLAQPNLRYPTGIRDRALMRTFYCAGLRCAEGLDLKVRDVNLAKNEVRVNKGKGGKDRILWVDDATVEMLDRWKFIRPRGEWFYSTLKGRHLNSSAVREMMARRGLKAGIPIRVHPHILRHTFASELLEEGYTIAEVQILLGHSRMETTSGYLHIAAGNLSRRLVKREVG